LKIDFFSFIFLDFFKDIDFGHFLGNYKEKYGIKRERAPFVFTPQYAAVLGGKNDPMFNVFVEKCKTAFNILRRNSSTFINLFQMVTLSLSPFFFFFLLYLTSKIDVLS
jgi:hypothetical protein